MTSEEKKYKVCNEMVNLWKVSTNTHGGLRFKVADLETGKLVDEAEAVRRYAEQISTDRQKFSADGGKNADGEETKSVKTLPGFTVKQIRDHSRCLEEIKPEAKPSASKSVSDSSATSLTD